MTDAPHPAEEIETPPPEHASPATPVERSISPISGRLGSGTAGKAVVVGALVVGCGVFLAATMGDRKPKAAPEPDQPARQVVRFEPASAASTPTLVPSGAQPPVLTAGSKGPPIPAIAPEGASSGGRADPAAQRRAELVTIRSAPMLAYSRGGGMASIGETAAPVMPAIQSASSSPTELDQLRRGSSIGRARASRLGDRNFLILAGTAIPCLLQTAMDTSTPGYVSCLIPRDVMSDNGAVVLMERGTKVLGEYRSGMRQGQKRLFVLWTRAVTPAGVAISLASPAADPLGRAGFDGAIDTHFWDRFGGALLLSIVDDGVFAIAGNGNQYQTARVPSDAAAIALQGSIDMPPTLRKSQGSEVSIFVAQDFDFSSVYDLKAR